MKHFILVKSILTLIIFCLLANFNTVLSQTGPGGVGNVNSNSILRTWLDASALDAANGDAVVSWTDRSGNTGDATHATAGRQPLFTTGALNGLPVLRFDGSDDRLDLPAALNTNANGILQRDYTVIAVAARRTTTSDDGWVLYGSAGANTNNLYLGWRGNTNSKFRFSQFGGGNNEVEVEPGDYVNNGVNQFAIFTGTLEQTASPARNLYENSSLIGTATGNTPLASWAGAALGRGFNSTDYSSVDIAEIIFYRRALAGAQRIILENYLSAKYDLPIANDHYSGDLVANGNFDYDVIGVGQEDDVQNIQAQGDALRLIADVTALDNGDYLLAGHHNTPHGTATTDLPATVQERWARSWYVDKTGALDATLRFDLYKVHPGRIFSTIKNNYVLLRKNGSVYEVVPVAEADKDVNNESQVSFRVSDAQLIDGEYTVGTLNATTTPLAGFSLDVREFCEYRANFN
ncbi:MAG: hypothetical protein WBA23_26035, partial [Tunicatimonas sp.]|uniref:hypothetical protein n=1 Tax=Tunicatimonas sp. TaxID=1940096 RepID=UPI003C71187F